MSERIKIVADSGIPFLQDRFPENVDLITLNSGDISRDIIRDADALLVRTRTRCDASLLEGSKVRLVVTATIGRDHIDEDWCRQNGILVESAPGCNSTGVAQYVLASILRLGVNPQGKRLGIIGHGNVGSLVDRWAQGIGFETLINDPPKSRMNSKEIKYHDLDYLISNSDIITLHVPFQQQGEFPTYHLIGEREIQMMKPGTILINSSRGGIVDESALKKAIEEKHIRTVVDVWENEPEIDRKLLEVSEISTPHIAGYSLEGKKRATKMALEALQHHLGIPIEFKGLECMNPIEMNVTRKQIEESYNPETDSLNLKKNPKLFEKLRNHYSYRHEPVFI